MYLEEGMIQSIIFILSFLSIAAAKPLDESISIQSSNPQIQFLNKHIYKMELPNATRYTISTNQLLDDNLNYSPSINAELAPIIALAKKAQHIAIHAFTDEGLSGKNGDVISSEQAQRILDFMWFQGVDYSLMTAKGMGYSHPKVKDPKETNSNFFNRRIEIDIN